MENPFIIGKAAEGDYFINRVEDRRRLNANLTHGINTVIISPRRWGKTSLVKNVLSSIDDERFLTVFVDVFRCKSEYEFYRNFSTCVIKQTSSKIDEWVETVKTFLSGITPKFSFGSDPLNDFSLSFEWNERDDAEDEILSLPQKIAEKKGKKIIVCLDEFQQIAEFPSSVDFQKKLRSVWQHQQDVTYCMFGSKKHLMENFFSNKSMPFFKFGDMMFLKKIEITEWIPFICRNFSNTGKSISEKQAERICNVTACQSSYVQQLSWITWYKTEGITTDKNIDSAIDDLLEQNKTFFQSDVEQLTELQYNFMRAVADGVTQGFTRKDILRKYRLESSANVQAIKKAMISKDLIYMDDDGNTQFNDPLFSLWVRKEK
ncbi:MAG: ATP-binding protein [Prevotella sp.]|nr:ATP-binding protein [Prevotella sp.]MBQ4445964.1 ATP-binding protein [Prevotella sp.]MBQ6308813.1 ATP-binding protein [Prevotella sp.]MBQ7440272.1 ATP-binding protein [Prevotella sp.]MBQ7717295.1 ATP-binding protein [Prevotella sp.]